MKTFMFIAAILSTAFSTAQSKISINLKKELDSIYTIDQKYRELLQSGILQSKQDSLAQVFNVSVDNLQDYVIKTMMQTDSSNFKRIEEIIRQYGYPGKTLVGTPTNEAAFYVIQHSPNSPNIDAYLPIIKKAAQKKELSYKLYAMMLDRSLMRNGKEQVYGTQGTGFESFNAQTGQKEWKNIIWPIKNPVTVNKRRKKAGFEQTVEDNAKRLGIQYQVLTLEDVRKMKGA